MLQEELDLIVKDKIGHISFQEIYLFQHLLGNEVCMGVVNVKSEGKFDKTKKFLEAMKSTSKLTKSARIKALAEEGVKALSSNTPVRTGKTASSWSYEIEESNGKTTISWTNDNIINHVNIAIILQYGHGTRNGGYVQGRDYINPALKPIFDQMTEDMWKAVISL